MQPAMQKTPSSRRQSGITLMESLVAIVVAALGVLGILGSQLRTLVDTQTSVHRAQAIRLIEDLSERMRANPNAKINTAHWESNWNQLPPAAAADCSSNGCDFEKLARYDMRQWKQSVKALLPQGDAKTMVVNDSLAGAEKKFQLMVLLAWRENEKDGSKTDAINYIANSGQTCPAGKTCHVQYIPIAARCYGTAVNLACP